MFDLSTAPELSPDWLTGRLAQLVRIPSVNGVDSERAMAERIAELIEPTGCQLTFVETLPGRPSLAAVLEGGASGPRLVINGHMDTVPPDDRALWSVDPFGGEVRDGAIWGRGAVDMKGGLVCQIACAHVLARLRDQLRGTLVLHFAVGEEVGEPGTRSLLQAGFGGDLGIVTEPTGLRVARAMRGVAYYQVTLHGRSSHGGRAELGRNPLAALGDLLPAIARYEQDLRSRTNPLFPPLTCTPTMARAGVQQNAIADVCTLTLDRRMLPGETSAGVLRELRDVVGAGLDPAREITFEVEQVHNVFEPCEISARAGIVTAALEVVEAITGRREEPYGTPYGSDVHDLIHRGGIEAITLGPGDIARAHAPDEYIGIDELATGALIITTLAARLLGGQAPARD
ncbi:MAG TPA: M20 family metallopeptidase [Solirubrobacteraceae bacterium]|nr:M20 family metallopeptidase [Solirubrobacteraceae bacterium]